MTRLAILLAAVGIGLQAAGQKPTCCYEYKIQYNIGLNKDSSIELIGKNYYNAKMYSIKKVVFGPGKKDSCLTKWKYDNHLNVVSELTYCSDKKKVVNAIVRRYNYDKNGTILKETASQQIPYFDSTVTFRLKDSSVSRRYTNKKTAPQNIYESKVVDMYAPNQKSKFQYSLSYLGDTLRSHTYLYFYSIDSIKIRSNISSYIGKASSANVDVIYRNGFNEDDLIDYYVHGEYKGSTVKKYNAANKQVFERYYSKPKDRVVFEISYKYDDAGILVEKKEENMEIELTTVWKYVNSKLVRQDSIFGETLDHSISYIYK